MTAWRRRVPHVAAALSYAERVVAGKIVACKSVGNACERQLADLSRTGSEFYFDAYVAERVCAFMERLPHVKGEWAKAGKLLTLEPWQSFVLTTVFGWKREDGFRRFRTAYVEVPRKNAKSTLAAGVGCYMTGGDGESGAEVYSNATTRDQAKIVFEVARQMARTVDLGLVVQARAIYDPKTASFFKPLHAQGETLDGYNIHCAINDELHAWKRRSVYDVIETATGARRQPLIFNITTAGDNLDGICYELRGYALRIASGQFDDDSFFGIVYTIDDGDDWTQPEVWRKANPNWDVSVYPMDVQSMAKKAREIPSETNAFLTKRLNVWVNSAVAWMDMMAWNRGFDPTLRLENFRGEVCYAGIDLASKIDVNSLAVIFKRHVNGVDHYYAHLRHWLPEEAIRSDRFGQYDGWVRSGHMRKTSGNVIDVDAIELETKQIDEQCQIQQLGVDPGHNSTQYGVHMAQAGMSVVDVRPTVMNFSEPMKWLEAWVKDGRFHHNCPVLTWMVSNVVAWRDNKDNIYPRKEAASRKIDGVVALLIAINRMMAAEGPSVYESRGVIVL